MKDDEIIDKTLIVFYNYRNHSHNLNEIINKHVFKDSLIEALLYENIKEKMERHKLIRPPHMNSPLYEITNEGKNIIESGGWIRHIKRVGNKIGADDRKNWRERHWLLLSLSSAVAGFALGFMTDITKELLKQKIKEPSTISVPQFDSLKQHSKVDSTHFGK